MFRINRFLRETAGTGSASTGGVTPPPPASTGAAVTPPPASTGGAATGTPPPPPPAQGTPWYGNLPEDLKGFVEAKKYPDLTEALKSHMSLEKMMGAPKERIIKLPENMTDKAAMAEIYGKLGRPEKAEGYDIPVPQGGSEDFAKWAKEVFHEAGLTGDQAKAVASKWNEYAAQQAKSTTDGFAVKSHEQLANLKTEWGAAYDANVTTAGKIAEELGVTPEQYRAGEQAFGVDGWAKILHGVTAKLGVKLGEPDFHRGETGSSGGSAVLTPAAAQAKLDSLGRDQEWIKRYMANGHKEVEEMHFLNRMISGGVDG